MPYIRLFDTNTDTDDDDDDDAAADADDNNEKEYEEIPDSNQIIDRILNDPEFDTTKCEEDGTSTGTTNFTKEQRRAITHCCVRMLEEHTAQIGFYYRYGLNITEFCVATELKDRVFMGDVNQVGAFIFKMFQKGLQKRNIEKSEARGLVRYNNNETVWQMSFDDLHALEELLVCNDTTSNSDDDDDQHNSTSNNCCSYFFGRSEPGVLDCTVFGHLSQFLYIEMEFPQKTYLKEQCPKLVRFMDHFRQTYFKDWGAKCERQPNDALKEDENPRMQQLSKKLQMMKLMAAGAATVGAASLVAIVVVASNKSSNTSGGGGIFKQLLMKLK